MKKLFSLMLALAMCCLTLSACAVGTGEPAAPDNDKGTLDTFVSSGNEPANSVVMLANSAGNTEINEVYGTITLSNPILYTISTSGLGKIDMSSMVATVEDMPYDEDTFGCPASEYPNRYMWPHISAVYAVPEGTTVTFPSGILTFTIFELDLTVENGTCRADELNVFNYPGFGAIPMPKPDPTSYIAVIELKYTNVPENSTVTSGGSGASGTAIGDGIAGYVAFYVPKDSTAENPFGSSTSTAPAAPVTPPPTGNSGFTDVAADAYYYEPVQWAVEKNITSGTTDTTFSPDNTCTTAQILTFLWRTKGSPEPTSTENPFTDVQESDYYYKAALWAKENNVLPLPFNPAFQGDTPCTRGMSMLYIWRAAGFFAAEKSSNFTDVPATTLYAPAVDWAVENGITYGTSDTTFSPDNTCTRAQIMTFLYRAFK